MPCMDRWTTAAILYALEKFFFRKNTLVSNPLRRVLVRRGQPDVSRGLVLPVAISELLICHGCEGAFDWLLSRFVDGSSFLYNTQNDREIRVIGCEPQTSSLGGGFLFRSKRCPGRHRCRGYSTNVLRRANFVERGLGILFWDPCGGKSLAGVAVTTSLPTSHTRLLC